MDMRVCIFGFDPANCPYDTSEMRVVKKWHGYKIDELIEFINIDKAPSMHSSHFPWTRGKIAGIGIHVRHRTGEPIVLFAIKTKEDVLYHKTHSEVWPVVA
ncbi:MAG: hypothetical protein UY94_C0010G0012 [Parcubacteria group bacterium GW2011_GWA2_56_21]|nr:MAG: hypothetical protein UY94_C0010G0012 [Parcubacteria group bacterium GW2011_GWA2_56_21]HCG99947.1 hypothetical protein [Actinomycetota bacterium]